MSNPHTSRAMRQFLKIFSQVSPVGLCAMVFTELYQLCFCFLLCNACLVSICVQCVEANWIARVQWKSCLMLAVKGPGVTPGCCGGCQSGLVISSWGFLAWRSTIGAVCEKGKTVKSVKSVKLMNAEVGMGNNSSLFLQVWEPERTKCQDKIKEVSLSGVVKSSLPLKVVGTELSYSTSETDYWMINPSGVSDHKEVTSGLDRNLRDVKSWERLRGRLG